MITQFFIPCTPPTVTKQTQRIVKSKTGKTIVYDTQELRQARLLFMNGLSDHRPSVRYGGAVRLTVKWLFPTSSDRYRDGEYKTTKPDTDNLIKLFKDCMTKLGFWKDDAQVASEINEKFWVKNSPPGIWVRIEDLWT